MKRAIAIDLGGTKTSAAIVEIDGSLSGRIEAPTPRGQLAQLDLPAALAREMMDEDVVAVGIAVAAKLDRDGVPTWAAALDIADVRLGDRLSASCDRPVFVVNDAAAAALAEARLGAGVGYRSVVVLTLGTGIGGGIVLDGRLYRGIGSAGELGHMVIDPQGPPCPCGRQGCWERLASGSALARLAKETSSGAPIDQRTSEEVVSAAHDGDDHALRLWHDYVDRLVEGLLNIGAILDPEVVVLGGGVSRQGQFLLDSIAESLARAGAARSKWLRGDLHIARFVADAGLVGAGLEALNSV
jgi:glucokinase